MSAFSRRNKNVPDIYRQFLCASLRFDTETARTLTEHGGWTWGNLFEAANIEAVLPTLSAAFADGLDINAPANVSDFLAAVLSLNRDRNASIREETAAAARLLNDQGIEPVLLKGVAFLAAGVYEDSGARYLIDIDLLVPEAELDLAVRTLLNNGYVEDDSDQFGRYRHHHPPLSRAGSPPIEIHHRLGLGRCESILPAREVIARALPANLDGTRVRIPCPEHLLTHLIVHSQMLHPYNERIWPPIRGMYDLIQLERRYRSSIDWNSIETRFRKCGLLDLLMLHLLDVRDELGFETPLPIRSTTLSRIRRSRRQLIRRWPALRYIDPIYMFSEVCTRRLRVLRNVLRTRHGLRHLIEQLSTCDVYERFLTDVIAGRGR